MLRADIRGFHADLGRRAMAYETDPEVISFLCEVRDDLTDLVLKLNRYLDN